MPRKILLADDSVTAQNMGRKILTDAGYEVITVNNGSAALKKIAEHKPDLIVLDVYMPGYSGLEVCQRTKENKETSRIPILLTVGKLEPFKPEEARRAHADAFVVKPFEASELLAAVTKLEDKLVPQPEPYKQGRFAKAAAALGSEGEGGEKFGDTDAGWKARLRIPTGTRKSRDSEPDVDYVSTQGKGFQSFDTEDSHKKRQAKAGATEGEFERPLPAGLPQDITSEEIAAITAAAALLRVASPAPVAVPEDVTKLAAPQALAPETAAEESAPATFASSPALQGAEPEQGVSQAQTGDAPKTEAAQPESATFDAAPGGVAEPSVCEAAKPEHMTQLGGAKSEPSPAEDAQSEIAAATDGVTTEPGPTSQASAEAVPAEPEVSRAAEPLLPPAEDEFMAALQSLMPVSGNGSAALEPAKGGEEPLPALAAIVAEVDSRLLGAHSVGPRWVAEEVALVAREATLSLQKEMEQAYAAFAAGEAFCASAASPMADLRGDVAAVSAPSSDSAEAMTKPQVAEQAAVLAMAAGAGEAGPVVAGVQPPTQEISVVQSEEKQNGNDEVVAADAGFGVPGGQVPQAVAESEAPVVASAEAAPALTEIQIAGGTEGMVDNWKNIREFIAGAAAKPALAKQEAHEVEPARSETEPPAAPAAENASPSFGAADPKDIASIVDSVLAELRPKIVEEIAKKLAEPKKA
ncbi:MAG TPA: response regulator [Terriglobales bacterium]|nr:response regulator [Terriglobales bacterium]